MWQRQRKEAAVMLSSSPVAVGQSGINCIGIESRSAPDYCGHRSGQREAHDGSASLSI